MTATFDIKRIVGNAASIITGPGAYFRAMATLGGYAEPLMFIAVMAAVMGVVTALLSLFSTPAGMLAFGLMAIIVMPLGAVIGSFIVAATLFVVWKIMGSEQSYETAFRCVAATAAIYPITGVLAILPYLGAVISLAWTTYLLIEASVIVHGRVRKTAQIVFGVLGTLLALSNLASEYASRQLASQADAMGQIIGGLQNSAGNGASPGDAMKAVKGFIDGEFSSDDGRVYATEFSELIDHMESRYGDPNDAGTEESPRLIWIIRVADDPLGNCVKVDAFKFNLDNPGLEIKVSTGKCAMYEQENLDIYD
jgi:hypothetical protein